MMRKGSDCPTFTDMKLPLHRVGQMGPVLIAGTVLMAVGFSLLSGGCATTHHFTVLKNPAKVKRFVQTSSQPVLLMFSKEGCPTCTALEPTMDRLAAEYRGRASVAKYSIYTFYFARRSSEFIDKYNITVIPTVILLVNGQQKDRWTMNYGTHSYRKALDQYAAPPGGDTAYPSSDKPKQQGLRPRATGAAEAFQPEAATDPPPCVDKCTPDAEEGDIRHDKR
jgi:thioredoxin 1